MFAFASLFRRHARRRQSQLQREDPAASQREQLRRLVRKARRTRFGRDHGFAKFRNLDDYQRNVPLRTWEQFWSDYWKESYPTLNDCTWPGKVPCFGLTAGTASGRRRPVPCTAESLAALQRAHRDVLARHLANRPHSRVLGGRICVLSEPAGLESPTAGVQTGGIDGLLAAQWPWLARRRFLASRRIANCDDRDQRVREFARLAPRKNVRMLCGMPPALARFFEELTGGDASRTVAQVLPKLQLLVHTGMNVSPYRKRFEKLLADGEAELRETYTATEGFLAVADAAPGDGLRLMTDNGVFFEFVPVGELRSKTPTRHWAGNVEPDVHYAVVLTTSAGLWSYVLDDTVRFVATNPPRVLVTGRVSQMLSAFGEDVVCEQLDDAMTAATASVGKRVVDFTVGVEPAAVTRKPGRHVILVEFSDRQPPNKKQITAISKIIDERIKQRNDAYRMLRGGDYGMRMPRIEVVPPGTFAAWLQSRGHHKVPRVMHNPQMLDELRSFAELSDVRGAKTAA
jgi:GH3 auxin-responsive promoter